MTPAEQADRFWRRVRRFDPISQTINVLPSIVILVAAVNYFRGALPLSLDWAMAIRIAPYVAAFAAMCWVCNALWWLVRRLYLEAVIPDADREAMRQATS